MEAGSGVVSEQQNRLITTMKFIYAGMHYKRKQNANRILSEMNH